MGGLQTERQLHEQLSMQRQMSLSKTPVASYLTFTIGQLPTATCSISDKLWLTKVSS
jgi:hypothetical protein